HLRIARLEFLVELAERGDLGRADEGEVLRPEKEHLPLAGEAAVVERLEGLVQIVRDDTGQGELRELLSNTEHESLRRKAVAVFPERILPAGVSFVQSIDFIKSIDRIYRSCRTSSSRICGIWSRWRTSAISAGPHTARSSASPRFPRS